MGYGKVYDVYVSSLTFSNMAYITRKKFPSGQIYDVLNSLLEFSEVTPVDTLQSTWQLHYMPRILKTQCSIILLCQLSLIVL